MTHECQTAGTLFEGPEKKLEIILTHPVPGLRENTGGRWDRVVDAARARILSCIESAELTAYLLSESSLFVWEDRVLMITCGTTTLIEAAPVIADIVGPQNVSMVFYERKNFMYPSRQPSDFEEDAAAVSAVFPGKSYRLGPANDDHVHVFYAAQSPAAEEEDVTFQVLMHDLSPGVLDCFTKEGACDPKSAERRSGLAALYPQMQRDRHLFHPCGFSENAVDGEHYFTVHVTPEPGGSYASFETNVLEDGYESLIEKVVEIFSPGRFTTVLWTGRDARCRALPPSLFKKVAGFHVTEKSQYEFDCGYAVSFVNRVRSV